jgi:hypothetical protein
MQREFFLNNLDKTPKHPAAPRKTNTGLQIERTNPKNWKRGCAAWPSLIPPKPRQLPIGPLVHALQLDDESADREFCPAPHLPVLSDHPNNKISFEVDQV